MENSQHPQIDYQDESDAICNSNRDTHNTHAHTHKAHLGIFRRSAFLLASFGVNQISSSFSTPSKKWALSIFSFSAILLWLYHLFRCWYVFPYRKRKLSVLLSICIAFPRITLILVLPLAFNRLIHSISAKLIFRNFLFLVKSNFQSKRKEKKRELFVEFDFFCWWSVFFFLLSFSFAFGRTIYMGVCT